MILFAGIFLFLFAIAVLCVGFGNAMLVSRQKQQIRTMLRRAETQAEKLGPDLLKREESRDPLTKALDELGLLPSLAPFIEQSGAQWTTGKFIILTTAFGFIGFLLGFLIPPFSNSLVAALVPACMGASLPLLMIVRKRKKRLAQFEEQFPEALSFLSRSMRAGHAFSIGLELLVTDSPEPLASTFRLVLNDLHLGASLEAALVKLVASVPLIDVRFFVSAILLQQGSGGNLSEILDTMAKIIRARFQLKGQVKAASAHGRITGLILAIMPVIVAAILFVISPEYLLVLAKDPDGKHLVIAAGIGQIIGFFCIRKIVNIKV